MFVFTTPPAHSFKASLLRKRESPLFKNDVKRKPAVTSGGIVNSHVPGHGLAPCVLIIRRVDRHEMYRYIAKVTNICY